jgi:hypothetical protein
MIGSNDLHYHILWRIAMPEEWQIQQQKRAETALSRLIEANPGLSVNKDQPDWLFGTNFVTFGMFHNQPVVFKYFDWLPRKKQEEKALRLFSTTGLVPKLYPIESDSILVWELLQGTTLDNIEKQRRQEQLERLYYQLGMAMAKIVEAAPVDSASGRSDLIAKAGSDYEFYCQSNVETLFDLVTEQSAKVFAEKDVPYKTVLKKSLSTLQKNRDAILAYPTFIQMDDFHTGNIIVDGDRLMGFIDLEMTRYGNEVLLLAAALAMTADEEQLEGMKRWNWIRRGYEDRRGKTIDNNLLYLACISASFCQWTRFMWYWSTDDLPQWAIEANMRKSVTNDIKIIIETMQKLEI